MKKRRTTILILFAVLLILIAALCLWQRNNLTALKLSLDYSRDDLSQMLEENNKRVDAVSDALDGVTVRDLTEEEKSALLDGSLSGDELIDRLVGGQALPPAPSGEAPDPEAPTASPVPDTPEQPASQPTPTPSTQPSPEPAPTPNTQPSPEPTSTPGTQPSPQPTPTPTPSPAPGLSAEQEKRNQLARYIAEIYLMKSEYTAWLETTHQAAIDEFVALPEEQQTTAKKYEIGMRYMRIGLDKEDECDRKMADLEAKILALLQELGEDTSLVNEIQAAYEEEKALKKAYYLGLH